MKSSGMCKHTHTYSSMCGYFLPLAIVSRSIVYFGRWSVYSPLLLLLRTVLLRVYHVYDPNKLQSLLWGTEITYCKSIALRMYVFLAFGELS